MNRSFHVHGIHTSLIRKGDDIFDAICDVAERETSGLQDGDVLVVAESALATSEGAIIVLDEVTPSEKASEYAARYSMDARIAEIVIRESDRIVGGIPGFLLCMKNGTLLPNAGVDGSNAPDGAVVLLPEDPDRTAELFRRRIFSRFGVHAGVIIADSRTHAMRLGCSGVAIGCAGFSAVMDERGRKDLFGRDLEVTQCALADNIASAAELVMGEADECTPAALIRGLGIPMNDSCGIETIDASECLFMGVAMERDPSLFKRERDSNPL